MFDNLSRPSYSGNNLLADHVLYQATLSIYHNATHCNHHSLSSIL